MVEPLVVEEQAGSNNREGSFFLIMMQIAKITPSSAEAGRLLFLLLQHVQLLVLA